jgi:hypothetical protein
MGGERALLHGLHLAHDLLDAVLPEEILHKARTEPRAGALAIEVQGRLFPEPPADPHPLRMALFHLRMRARLRDKALYVLRAAMYPTYPEFDAFPLPAPLLVLYPLILPAWRLVKHGSRLLRDSPGPGGLRQS